MKTNKKTISILGQISEKANNNLKIYQALTGITIKGNAINKILEDLKLPELKKK